MKIPPPSVFEKKHIVIIACILVYLLYLEFNLQEELMDVYIKSNISDNGEASISACYIKTYLLKSYVSILALVVVTKLKKNNA